MTPTTAEENKGQAPAQNADANPSEPTLDRPVFVMGTGRCGLTPLMHLIAYHPEFAWPSQYHGKYPKKDWVARLARILDYPGFRSTGMKWWRYVPVHDESYPFWQNLFYGFSEPIRDIGALDVSPYTSMRFRHALSRLVELQGKRRFISEYSGWSRIEFFRTIFPDARFIHIVRDARAVVNSLTHVGWWKGWEGVYKWRWGVPPADMMAKLEQYDHSYLALAAIHWKILIRNILEKSAALGPKDLKVVRYEDLVKDPPRTARECIEFCDLDPNDDRFQTHLKSVKIVDANSKKFRIPSWKNNMTPAQIDMINDIVGDELNEFEYLSSVSEVKQ